MPEQGRGKRGHAPDQVRLAREALAAARAQAQAKGLRPGRAAPPGRAGPPTQAADQEVLGASAVDTDGPAVDSSAPGARPAAGSVPEPRRDQDARLRGDSLRRVRRDDPQALGSAIEGLLDTEGWNLAAATGSVFGRWAQIVGADLAGHTQPESLRDGELTVVADSTAWATQLDRKSVV